VIISTGAGVAVPTCFLGKFLFKSKFIFIESFCRIKEPSLSGKLIYPIADLFFVQWKNLLNFYGKKAIYRGSVV
jgi:beta-1,4-N-acetylglucosaminyltransferase